MIKLNWGKNKGGKKEANNSSPPKIKLAKGTRFVSFLFIATSMLIAAGVMKAANMYYDIDSGKIIVNEIQRVVQQSGATVALEIVGISKFGDGIWTNYAQFSETGDLSFFGTADTITGPGVAGTGGLTMTNAGPLTLSTTTSGTLAITSIAALNLSSTTGAWDATTLGLNASGNANLTTTGSATSLTLAATGVTTSKVIINAAGTGADAIDINATGTGGGIDINTIDGGIAMNAGGAINGDITFTTGDDMTLSVGDDFSLTGAAGSIFGIATGDVVQFVNIGTGTAKDTINIGTGGGADEISIGGGAADVALTDADWSITGAGVANFVSLGVTTAGTGAFTTLTSSGDTTLGTGASSAHTYSTGAGSTTTLGNTTGAMTLASGGASSWTNTTGNLTVSTAGASGDLIFTSIEDIDMNFAVASGFTLGDSGGATDYLEISDSGTLTLRSAAEKEIVLNPGDIGGGNGVIRLGAGDQILTSSGGAASRLAGEQILREIVPIFGFDLPARTGSDTFITVSRVLETDPFLSLGAVAGSTRQYKFIIRYADDGTTGDTSWSVCNFNDHDEDDTANCSETFTVPASTTADFDKGNDYITPAVTLEAYPWRIAVKAPTVPANIQIYSIDLAAYDVVD